MFICLGMLDISRQLYTEIIDDISGENVLDSIVMIRMFKIHSHSDLYSYEVISTPIKMTTWFPGSLAFEYDRLLLIPVLDKSLPTFSRGYSFM